MQLYADHSASLTDARHKIRHTDMYGRVSAIAWNDPYLPYAGGTVNLLVTKAGKDADIPQPEMDRVLAPKGVRIEVADGAKIRPTARKPRPAQYSASSHGPCPPFRHAETDRKEVWRSGEPDYVGL